jgi:hypothetical protein
MGTIKPKLQIGLMQLHISDGKIPNEILNPGINAWAMDFLNRPLFKDRHYVSLLSIPLDNA